MAQITSRGVVPTDLAEYVSLLEDAFKNAVGQDLDVSPETPQGQIIGVIAFRFSQIDEVIVNLSNAFSVLRATGRQLDDLGSLLRIPRIQGERSSVTVTVTGDSGTRIPAFSQVRTEDGNVFSFDNDVLIPTAGQIDVDMFSIELGPIPASAGTLNVIVSAIAGWNSVNNTRDASLGRLVETDEEYRLRLFDITDIDALQTTEAIRAAILDVEGVVDCIVEQNDTDAAVTRKGVQIGANSIVAIVQGGASNAIGSAILKSKSPGTGTSGSVTVDINSIGISFERVKLIPIKVTIRSTANNRFPPTGVGDLKQRVFDWMSGFWSTLPSNYFEQNGVKISEGLVLTRLYTPINSVPGHVVTGLTVERKDGSGNSVTEINLDERLIIESVNDVDAIVAIGV